MNLENMKTIAKIIKETAKIREESYDHKAVEEANKTWLQQFGEDSIPIINYGKYYKLSLSQSAHEAIKIHAPELQDINYPSFSSEDFSKYEDEKTTAKEEIFPDSLIEETSNLFACFIDLSFHWSNDILDWADAVLQNEEESK